MTALRTCDTLCTSGFAGDVTFSYHGANEPESSTTLCLEEVRQVAVPVGRHTNWAGPENALPKTSKDVNWVVFLEDQLSIYVIAQPCPAAATPTPAISLLIIFISPCTYGSITTIQYTIYNTKP